MDKYTKQSELIKKVEEQAAIQQRRGEDYLEMAEKTRAQLKVEIEKRDAMVEAMAEAGPAMVEAGPSMVEAAPAMVEAAPAPVQGR